MWRAFSRFGVLRCQEPVIIEDQSVARHLYRIAHEAACNAAKHSQANAIAISLDATKKTPLPPVSFSFPFPRGFLLFKF